jgi:hypothetical protein
LNDLNFAQELSSLLVQITAGANFCKVDNRYTHAFVARCPSGFLKEGIAHSGGIPYCRLCG